MHNSRKNDLKENSPELSREKKFEVTSEAQQRTLELERELQDICKHLQVSIKELENYKKAQKVLNEETNRAQDAFIAHLNHELRTALTSILGFSNLLQKDPRLNSQQLHYVELINYSGRHLLNLINDLQDFSQITAKKLRLNPQDFNLIQFLNEIATVFSLPTQQKGLKFQTNISPSLPTIVNADETKLRQVLYNLLTNAIKFTETGSVTLKVGYVGEDFEEISTAPCYIAGKPHQIRFQIEDTGIGIPANHFPEIFTPFRQLNDRVKKYEGMGLGLTISQNIIQLMGSQIQLESEVNRGSKFWFNLELLVVETNLTTKVKTSEAVMKKGNLGNLAVFRV